jgi:hypothetical protein
MDVHATTPAPREAWLEVLREDGNDLVTQTPAWLDCVCSAGGYEDASRLYETGDGRRLVLPLVRRARAGVLSTQASLPHAWGVGGLVGAGTRRAEDVAAVLADLARSGVLRTSLRPNPLEAEAWAAARPAGVEAVPRLAHVLDLEGGFDEVWSRRFPSATRTKIRRAERAGLDVELDTTGRLVPAFYGLYEQSLERWAAKQHEPAWLARRRGTRRDPLEKFELLARALGDAFRLWVARLDGRPVAAIVVLVGANASYTRGAMDAEPAGRTFANYLLHRLAIEDACAAGCRWYHMGETGGSASLAHFKTRLGAEAYAYAEYHVERVPLTALDRRARGVVKRLIGFRDTPS